MLNEIADAAEAVGKIVVREVSEASGFGDARSAEGYADPRDYIIHQMQENTTRQGGWFAGGGAVKDLLFLNRVRPGGRWDNKGAINHEFSI